MTRNATVNLFVIGRSPRPDLEAEFRRVLGDTCEIRTIGALDRLDTGDLRGHPPNSDADMLYTILPNGESQLLSKAFVTGKLHDRLATHKPCKGRVDVLCCTGRFDELTQNRIIAASDVLLNTVRGLGPLARNLGVFIPKQQQAALAVDRWRASGFDPSVISLAPDASEAEIDQVANRMRDLAPDVVAYDCISYSHATRLRVRKTYDVPAVVASSATAHVVAELLGI